MCESVPLKAPQRRRSDSAAYPARPRPTQPSSEALSKNPPKRVDLMKINTSDGERTDGAFTFSPLRRSELGEAELEGVS